MKNSFLVALDDIKTADKHTIVAKVFELFSRISTMNKEEIIATHQTFWFFYEHMKDLSDADDELFQKINDAIGNRMLALCCEPQDRSERARLVELFGKVLGGGVMYYTVSAAVDGFQPKKK